MSGQTMSSRERLSQLCKKTMSVTLSLILVLTLTVFVPGDFLDFSGTPTVAHAAQTDFPGNISQARDAGGGAGRTQSFDRNYFRGTPNNGQDPEGGNYYQLAIDASNQYSWRTMPITPSAEADWSVDGYFSEDRIAPNNSPNGGDFIAINIYPRDADQAGAASASGGGGGLGLVGTPGAIGIGMDFVQNNNYNDPAPGPFGYFRWSGAQGTPQPMGNRTGLYTNGTSTQYSNLTQWSLPVKYRVNYVYNNGSPYYTGSLDDRFGRSWNFDTRNTGGDALGIGVPSSRYWNVALMSANGDNHQNFRGSIDRFTGQLAASTYNVNYILDGTNNQIAPSTTILSGVDQRLTIRGAVNNDVANSTWSYNGNPPVGVQSQYQNGYHVSRTWDYADNSANGLRFQKNDSGPYAIRGNFDVYYAPDFQFARLFTANDPQGSGEKENISGVTNGTMSGWQLNDSNMARPGRNYTVRAPNGQTYASLSAARAAVNTFDATNNGAARSDSSPQDFTVTYALALQEAIVRGVTNGQTSEIARYNNTNDANVGTPNRPLEEGTTGALKSNVQDAALAKPGYTYTVTAPNGQTYPNMQQAWAATNTWDTTANPPGATSDSQPQVWTVNYQGGNQIVNLVRNSADGRGPTGTVESPTGPSGSRITFNSTDTTLAVAGYTYTVDVYNGTGTRVGGPYNSLSAALTAQPNYDANQVPAGGTDSEQQRFQVNYTPSNQNVTYHYVDTNGNTIKANDVTQQPTNADINTANPPAIQDYIYRNIDTARSDSDMRVNGDGSSQVYRVYEMDPAIRQNAQTAINNSNTSTARNEPTVTAARTDLQNVLNNPASTAQQIKDATDRLNNAVRTAETDQANARRDAQTATNNANNSTVRNDPAVVAAQNNLNNVLNDPNSTAQQIRDATNQLNTAVTNATTDKNTATQQANTAKDPANTSPVTHEPAVDQALTNLNNVLNNPNSTAQQIRDATNQLNTAVADAKTARNQANTDADAAKQQATNSPQANDQRVVDAMNNLNQLQRQAAADSSSSSTQQIRDAITALNNARTAAANDQTTARQNAQTAMSPQNTSPVSNEPEVVQRRNELQTVLNNPNSTAAQIQQATDALNNAVTSAKQKRNDAKSSAQAAIQKAENSTPPPDQATRDAITALRNTIARADADTAPPDSLTADIISRTNAVTTASGASDAAHTQARQNAQNAMNNTSPVSNEPTVAPRRTELQNILNNPNSTTQQINDATTALNNAVNPAKTERNTAVQQANDSITQAQNDPQVNQDPRVKTAITNLQNAITQANNDSPQYLTADINRLRTELQNAVTTARTENQEARQRAQEAIQSSSPVSNEPGVPNETTLLQNMINDPNATATQLNNATTAYNTQVNNEKAKRDTANTDGNTLITNVNNSPVRNETPVQQAITNLQNVMQTATTNTPQALTKDIQAAIDNLKRVQQEEQTKRDTATNNANTAITNANNSPVKNEPTVIAARDNLQNVLNNPNSTTQQIIDATNNLNTVRQQAEADRTAARNDANTAITNANNSNVKNEPTVTAARDRLNNLLNDPNATTQQIRDATTQLNNAVRDAQTARTQANTNADNAITRADPVKNQPTVQQAITDLNNVRNDPNSTTQQIVDATNRLNTATDNATRDRQTANDQANTAKSPAQTSPVSNEPGVVAARNNLNTVQSNPNSTTAQITEATNQMNTATNDAKTARNTAITEGESLNNSTRTSPVGQEPSVVAAMNRLTQVMDQSKTDSPQALTADIRNAMQQVRDAAATAQSNRDKAKQAIADADASPGKNEQAVKDAKQNLQNVLNNPASTNQQIIDATNALNTAVQNANNDRANANRDAQTAINNSNQPPNNDAQSVIDARNNLQNVMNNPNSTNQQIRDATTALNNAVRDAYTDRDNAIRDAKTTMNAPETQPVTHEPEDVAGKNALNGMIGDPNASAAQIRAETEKFKATVAGAKTQRNQAIDAANQRMSASDSGPYANNPGVIAAKNRLNEVIARSRTDVSSALTADIRAAIQALDDANAAAVPPPARPPAPTPGSGGVGGTSGGAGGSDAGGAGGGRYSDIPPTGDTALPIAAMTLTALAAGLMMMLAGAYILRRKHSGGGENH